MARALAEARHRRRLGRGAHRHRDPERPGALAPRRRARGTTHQGRRGPATRPPDRRQPPGRARGGGDPLRRGQMGAHGPARSQGRHRRAERRRRDLGRPQGPDQADGRVVADAGPGGRRQPRRHGPAHGPRARRGGRLLLRHQPVRPRFAGQAPARLLLQAAGLRGRARQRLQADQHRARRADRDRSGPRQGGVAARRTTTVHPHLAHRRCGSASRSRATR